MVALAAQPILTTIGRVAVPKLADTLVRTGANKFVKQYGQKAFEAVLGTTAGLKAYKETEEYLTEYLNHIDSGGDEGSFVPKGSMPGTDRMTQMDAAMAVPNVNESVRETGQGLVIGGEAKEILPPPEPFSTPIDSQTATILSTPIPEKVDTTLSTPIPEKIDTKESFPDLSGELSKPIIYYNEKVGKKMLTKESTDYRLQHKPRGPDDEYPVRLDDLTQTTTGESAGYPKDFYSEKGKRIYAPGQSFEGDEFGIANNESYSIINSVKGNPDAEVTIYRAVPNEKNITKINSGDFVTLSKRYADLHGAGGYGTDGTDSGKVLELKVKVKDIYWDQNDVNEFGYFPEKNKDVSDQTDKLVRGIGDNNISKQTKDLVPEKAELGPLSAVEKQTALALKGDKPDFYSRAVEAIENAKQDKSTKGKWKSIVQSNSTKEEIKYLGLDKYLQGNESITKQELLDFVDQKNIADKLNVIEVPLADQLDFSQYSIGGAGGKRAGASESTREVLGAGNAELPTMKGYKSTVEQYVFQVGGVDIGMADTAHFPEKYAKDTIAHARAQTGYFNADAVEKRLDLKEADGEKLTNNDKVLKNASRQLEDTFIIDEIQSDMIQDRQKKGTKEDFVIIKGKDITPEFIKKNYPNYNIKNEPLDILVGKSLDELKERNIQNNYNVLYSVDSTTGVSAPEVRLQDSRYYVFDKGKLVSKLSFDLQSSAQKVVEDEGLNPLPITESKKYVELVLNAMIKKAVEKNLDSIGITNGQIQYDRYTGQPIEDKEGLKKFYDEIVYKQLEKVADKYNVKLETVKLPGKGEIKEFDDIGLNEPTESGDGAAITRRASRAIRNGFVLRKISGNLLASTLDDLIQGRFEDPERANNPGAVLPNYTSILTDTGVASGDMVLENLIEDSADTDGDKNYYIWVAPNTPIDTAIQEGTDRYSSLSGIWDIADINLQMPISPAIQTEGADFVQTIRENEGRDLTDYFDEYEHSVNNSVDVNNYNNYINNFYNKENVNIGYSHEIIKMPLPKKLQKDILSKPIKLSKLKTQTNKMLT